MSNPQVSIVVPVYNAAKYLDEMILSVQAQTFTDWELILVDDSSLDSSVSIAQSYALNDERIIIISSLVNQGVSLTRNIGLDRAVGRYIAFQDADDLWDKEKLSKQLAFMKSKKSTFSFTGYEFIDEDGVRSGKIADVPSTQTYLENLKNTAISTITVMFDSTAINKDRVKMQPMKGGEDVATWWSILKEVPFAHGLNETLSYYRRSSSSLSANKLHMVRVRWRLYRNYTDLSYAMSVMYMFYYAQSAIKRRI